VEGSGTSGIDTCELGAMCWNVDTDGDGTCIEICSGSSDDPQCTTPGTTCAIANGGAIAVCMPTCDPLIGDCPAGQGCYPVGEALACAQIGGCPELEAGLAQGPSELTIMKPMHISSVVPSPHSTSRGSIRVPSTIGWFAAVLS
jgi:hypothetical protein